MPNTCCVYKCTNRASPNSNIAFFRFPEEGLNCSKELRELQRKRREKWFSKIRRENVSLQQMNTLRICSDHFVSGKYINN